MILGLFTQVGIDKTIEARDNEGFDIFVEKFGVSTIAGALDPLRTTPNTEFYNGAVSGRIKINQNTIQVICTVPAGQSLNNENIREIYLYGKDSLNNDFLLAFGQPQNLVTGIVYDPDGSVTLKLQISLVNVNLTALYQFTNTIAVELDDHNNDPNAHFEYVKELRHAGIKVDSGSFNDDYEGALYDKRAEFDGNKAQAATTGVVVTFQSTYRGTELNGAQLTFDGVKTVDQVRSAWNIANPDTTVEHDGAGTEVPPAQVITLTGGSYNVAQLDLVYKATDGLYKKALAGVSGAQAKPFGFAYLGERTVKPLGLHKYTHSLTIGANVYLSDSVAGAITTTPTAVKVGYVHGLNTIALNLGVPNEGADDEYDAIVTDIAGVKNFPTTQQAINFVGSSARILINKLEDLTSTLSTTGKRIDFFFAGRKTGWRRYAGTTEQHLIQFSSVPDSGTWRIVYSPLLETPDFAFNANAATIQAAINALFPLNPCTVTGNYSVGFTITHTNLADVPNPYFTDLGQNEIQNISFSNVPDNGSAAFDFNGQVTAALAWNDNAAQLEVYLEALSNLTDVSVSGNFTTGFSVEFTGVDGVKPQPQITVAPIPVNTLALGVSPTAVNITTTQQGKYPANALLDGANPVTITANIVSEGSAIGSSKAIIVDQPYTTFRGLGLIQNFTDGIDLNGQVGCDIEMIFDNVTNNILNTGLTPNKDYHARDSFGTTEQREIIVGAKGDYQSLLAAHTAANAGDKIIVAEDQTITAALVLNKEVEIEFIHNSKINVLSNIAGSVLTLSGKVKTKNLKLFINHASSFTTGILFTSQRGHHQDIILETSSSVTITNGVQLDSGCSRMFADGALEFNSAVVTNKVLDNASVKNNNYNFREAAGNILPPVSTGLYGYDAVVGSPAQVAAGLATHDSIQDAHDDVVANGCIYVLKGNFSGNLSFTKPVNITGQGYASLILGNIQFASTASRSSISNMRIDGDITFDNNSTGCILERFWQNTGRITTDNNTIPNQNLVFGIGE